MQGITWRCTSGALVALVACLLWSGTAWAHKDDVVVVKRGRHHRDAVVVRERRRHRDVVVVHQPRIRHREVVVVDPFYHHDVIVPYPVVVPSTSVSTFNIAAPIRIGDTVVHVGYSKTRVYSDGVIVSPFGSHVTTVVPVTTVVRGRCRR